MATVSLLVLLVTLTLVTINSVNCLQLRVFTVATESTDGFVRFNRSLSVYGVKSEVLGHGMKWQGGNVIDTIGGGHKVNLLKDALKHYKDEHDLVVLFTDSYDVVFTAGDKEILDDFKSFNANVVFSAEKYCWPNSSLEMFYPSFNSQGKRFLNSGAFIGFAPVVYQMISTDVIENEEDDQLFYTQIYLNEQLRNQLNIKLDEKSKLFQNLNGAYGEIELKFKKNDSYIVNNFYHTQPKIIHGNGPSKIHLNSLANYLAKSWTLESGCLSCSSQLHHNGTDGHGNGNGDDGEVFKSQDDILLMCLFIEHATPFLPEFFQHIERLNWPKDRMSVRIHNSQMYHGQEVERFINTTKDSYHSIELFHSNIPEWQARNLCLEDCLINGCSFYLSVDSDARLTDANTITKLIQVNKDVVAPLLVRPGKLWSNFWGSLSPEGYYARSFDYIHIVNGIRRGTWNVPHISQAYLISGSFIKRGLSVTSGNEISSETTNPSSPFPSYKSTKDPSLDCEMAFSYSLRRNGIFMYVTNLQLYGHLTDSESYSTEHKHNDLYELFNNRLDWERRYIHPNYSDILKPNTTIEQPCPDVYWFPIVTPIFCKHLVEEMEHFGKWSSGTNQDERLAGGYENVPTRDIHMKQVGFEKHWLYFLREYIRPVQEKVFIGYYHDPPKAIMNFVVRYRPDEQPFLRPHHDSSTYTINIALNRPQIDYQGGGCRFIRYNCSVTDVRLGWSLIHPGRLTHYHEGLRVTSGTRYIMVSFVDP